MDLYKYEQTTPSMTTMERVIDRKNTNLKSTSKAISHPHFRKDDVPPYFHVPFIECGYRHIHKPWAYYVTSIFRCNIETLNVWTHVAGFALVLARIWQVSCERDLSEPRLQPLLASFLMFSIMFASSSIAHMFSHKSITVNCVFFMADIASVGLYGFGTIINHYSYSVPTQLQNSSLHQFAMPIGVLLTFTVCVGGGFAKVIYADLRSKSRVLIMASSIGALYYFSNFPLFYRMVHEEWTDGLWFHAKQSFYFHCTAFFFCSRIPERFFPGKFDIIGNSHQLFHVAMVLCTERHFDGVLWDIDNGPMKDSLMSNHFSKILPFVLMVDLCTLLIFYFVHAYQNNNYICDKSEKVH